MHTSHELKQHMRAKHRIDLVDYFRSHIEKPSEQPKDKTTTDKTIRRLQVLIKKLKNDQTGTRGASKPAAAGAGKAASAEKPPAPAAAAAVDADSAKSHPSTKWVNR